MGSATRISCACGSLEYIYGWGFQPTDLLIQGGSFAGVFSLQTPDSKGKEVAALLVCSAYRSPDSRGKGVAALLACSAYRPPDSRGKGLGLCFKGEGG